MNIWFYIAIANYIVAAAAVTVAVIGDDVDITRREKKAIFTIALFWGLILPAMVIVRAVHYIEDKFSK
jgi:hypothetical protein